MQEIAKYILSQLPKLNDFELDQIGSLATTIRVSRKVRKHYTDNPALKHNEPEHHCSSQEIAEADCDGDIRYCKNACGKLRMNKTTISEYQGDWVVNTDIDKPM